MALWHCRRGQTPWHLALHVRPQSSSSWELADVESAPPGPTAPEAALEPGSQAAYANLRGAVGWQLGVFQQSFSLAGGQEGRDASRPARLKGLVGSVRPALGTGPAYGEHSEGGLGPILADRTEVT